MCISDAWSHGVHNASKPVSRIFVLLHRQTAHHGHPICAYSDVRGYHPLFFNDATITLLDGSDVQVAVRQRRDSEVAAFDRKFVADSAAGRELEVSLLRSGGFLARSSRVRATGVGAWSVLHTSP